MNYLEVFMEAILKLRQGKRHIITAIIASCLSTLQMSCKPTDIISPPITNSNSPLEVVWQVPIRPDTSLGFGFDPIFVGESIFFGSKPTPLSAEKMHLIKVSKTGHVVWQISPDENSICDEIKSLESSGHVMVGDLLYCVCKNQPIVIDMKNLLLQNEYAIDSSTAYQISSFDQLLFYTTKFGSLGTGYDSSVLVVADPFSGRQKTLFRQGKNGDFNPNLYPPEVFVNNPTGDTLLVFQNRQWDFTNSANGGRVDLFCWNMSADTLVWQIPEIDPYGNSSVCKPLYHDGLVYFRGFQTLHAVNVETGEQVWMHEFPGDFDDLLLGNMLIAEGKLIVKSSTEGIHAFDPGTGALLWERYDAGNTSCYMSYFDGSVFYGNYGGELFNVRVADGEILWAYTSKNEGKNLGWEPQFNNGVIFDEENRRIITTDGYYLICLQL